MQDRFAPPLNSSLYALLGSGFLLVRPAEAWIDTTHHHDQHLVITPSRQTSLRQIPSNYAARRHARQMG